MSGTRRIHRAGILLLLCTLLLVTGCDRKTNGERQSFLSLGTVCAVTLPAGTSQSVYDEIKQEILRINDVFSRTAEGSELYALNRDKTIIASEEFYALVEKAVSMAKLSDGAFDPAIGGITALWNIATDHPRVPSQEEIDQVDRSWQEIVMDPAKRRITIPKNMDVDLGGIAKGYAADRAHEIMEKRGVVRGIINLGGNVYAIGSKENGDLWKIGLRDPNGEEGSVFIVVHLADRAVVTSGGYERFFVQDGKTYQHILDPKTGWPAESDLLSSSIIGTDSTVCDALSTAVYVLGSEKGLALINILDGFDCVLMKTDGTILFSDNFPYTTNYLT